MEFLRKIKWNKTIDVNQKGGLNGDRRKDTGNFE